MKNNFEKLPPEASDEALFRYQIVSQTLSREQRGETRAEAIGAVTTQDHWTIRGGSRRIIPRTLYRWLAAFKKGGFSALEPESRCRTQSSIVLPESLLGFFKEQKRQDPRASIPELINRAQTLHLFDQRERVERTTVWRSLRRMGVDTTRAKTPKKDRDCRRFAYPHRMDMVLCDGKHFRAGAKRLKRVALFFLDDASRMALGVVVGTAECAELFLRGFYEALLKYGVMSSFYVDHGPGFIANDVLCVMRQLNILFIHGTVRYPEGHGKIEKFNQTAKNAVLRTLDANPQVDPSCESLELRLRDYLFKQYNHAPHESLNKQAPYSRFYNDERVLRFEENREQLQKKFVVRLNRRVSKDNVVSVDGKHYETPRGHAGERITLFCQLLDETISLIHQGRLVRLHIVDVHANARDRRAKTQDETDETRPPLPKTNAEINFERRLRPIVDANGGFSAPIKGETR